jgi:ATP-dependent RNA helicase DeaD
MPFNELPPLLAEALASRGYEQPTAVQAQVLEAAADRDLIVSAQTGSGKTVAFGLAMAAQLLDEAQGLPRAAEPLALVIAPTRELALQVSRELVWLYGKAGGRIATCVGGMDPSKERRALGQGAHVVVGTPGRLRDHLERGALDLSALRVAVLDEADEMLDMGFREELEAILDATPDARRTLLFSATMPKPIVALAKRYQRDALRISTVGEERGHGDIAYQAVTVAPSDIEHAVVNLLRLHEAETAMLFCATRDNVRRLHASLVERGFDAVALSGEHSQNERNAALQALRDRRSRVCVATDVAARGIDLPSLSLVIHVELPRDAETLQHRSGRTGRAGKKGTAILLVPYPRRKRVDMMLRGAKIAAEWLKPPTPEDIRARIASGCWQPCSSQSRWRKRIASSARGCWPSARPRRSPRHWSARIGPVCPPRRRCSTAVRMKPRSARRGRAPASTTASGSAWTSAAATMPIRAGCSAALPPRPHQPERHRRDPDRAQ